MWRRKEWRRRLCRWRMFSDSRAQLEIKILVQPESEHISTADFITYYLVSDLTVDADLYRVSFAVTVYSFILLLQSTLHCAYYRRRHVLALEFWFFLLIYVSTLIFSDQILFRIITYFSIFMI